MSNYPDSLQINPASSPNLRTSVRLEAQSALKTAARGGKLKKRKEKKMECAEWRIEGWGVGNWKREVVIIFARLGTSERQTSTAVLQQKKKKKG